MTQTSQRLQAGIGDRYRIERELGRGGMADVYLAEDLKHRRLVAIKVLRPEFAPAVAHARFLREIEIVARLNHPNVLALHDSGSANGLVYYVMPFVQGESLRARLQHGSLPIDEALEILRTIADAVAYAHQQGIVHRDLKPENILFQSGHPLIADFGIARAAQVARTGAPPGDDTLTRGVSLGTPAYMAPEQAAADPGIDHRADLYTIGVIAYEMLAGQRPFVRSNTQQVVAAHISEKPRAVSELRPDTPRSLAGLVMRCLEKDPRNRPQSAGQIATELREISVQQSALSVADKALLEQRRALKRALWIYATAFSLVGLTAWIVGHSTGLPDWVFPGAVLVMALGLPVMLLTASVQGVAFQHSSTANSKPDRFHALLLRLRPHATWRSVTTGGIAAMLGFSLIVAGFMTLRAFGIGPPGTLLAAGALQPNEPLLVADFRVEGADSTLGPALAAATRAALEQSSAISIVSPARVSAALARMEKPRTQRIDFETAREIALREGIKGIIQGEVTSVGGPLVIALRLVAAESGATLAPFSMTVDNQTQLIPAIDKLSRKMRSKIGESLKRVRDSPGLATVTTPSLEALRKFSAAGRAVTVERDNAKAVRLLQEAVAIDTGFAMGWRLLSVALSNAGIAGLGDPLFDSAVAKSFRFRDRLTASERESVEGFYYWKGPGRDRQLAANIYEALAEREPASRPLNLGQIYWDRREFARAESLNRTIIAKTPNAVMAYENLIEALYEQGKLTEAETTIAFAERKFSSRSPAIASALPYLQGDLQAYERGLDSLQSDPREDVRSSAARDRANLALLRGQLADYARRRTEETRAGVAAAPGAVILDSTLFARIDAELGGNRARAIRRLDNTFDAAQKLAPRQRQYRSIAVTYARLGLPNRARVVLQRHLTELNDTSLGRWERPLVNKALAEIALAEGRYTDAIDYFRRGDRRPDGPVDACSICLPLSLGETFDAAGQPDSAIVMFEVYLNTPYSARGSIEGLDPLNVARVHERLGQLYEMKGQRSAALSHYRKFIELWQHADRELQPRVAAARQRLSLADLPEDYRPRSHR